AGKVAAALSKYRRETDEPPRLGKADIAFLQGIVAATMSFEEVIRFVVPMTNWWSERKIADNIETYRTKPAKIVEDIQRLLGAARVWQQGSLVKGATPMRDVESHIRYIVLAGLILWAKGRDVENWKDRSTKEQIRYFLESPNLEQAVAQELARVFGMKQP